MSEVVLPGGQRTNMSNSSHVAVLAFPFGTHAAPLLSLVRRLATSAPSLRFSFFSTSNSISSIFPGSETDEFGSIRAYSVWDGMPEGRASFPGNIHEAVGIFLKATPGNFELAMEEAEMETGKRISCLLTDAFLWFAGDLAEKRGVPWIPYWTAASCSLSVHMYTDVIRSKVDLSEKAEQTLEFLPGLAAIHINDLPEGVLMETTESPLDHLLYNMALKLPRATAVVLNSFEEIDPAITRDLKSKLQKILNVGPSTLSASMASSSGENECLQWLEKQNHASVAYISFGTITTPPPDEMVALAEALETIKVPFLWSLRDHARKLLPDEFLDRASTYGKFVSWAPQLQVLAHSSVGAFVTHCGWNSILESISQGVPMICRPFFGDQMLNSRMVEEVWRIGVRIEGGCFTKDGAINAINLVLAGNQGNSLRENVKGLREKALDATKPNGSSARNFEALLKSITSLSYQGTLKN